MLVRMWQNPEAPALPGGSQTGAAALENGLATAQKLNADLPYIRKRIKTCPYKTCMWFAEALFLLAKSGNHPNAHQRING